MRFLGAVVDRKEDLKRNLKGYGSMGGFPLNAALLEGSIDLAPPSRPPGVLAASRNVTIMESVLGAIA
ncbi:hypothetical protein MJO28_016716 [Puccinia striiformis f. sp. tritici]|uniref:Uncharacterized protein n=1 Tax=Puccinia striiformis f. sp. tritici TaxID=168172 RepID=A0ACC0DNZ6_9BASI|nr:hypothetical protein MJO28_016716 [Puccinia striiformis f. sp. tritici]